MKEKEYTIDNLKADGACKEGMAFVAPLIESGEFTPEKLLAEEKGWLIWAVIRGYSGRELVANDFGPQMDLVIDLVQRARSITSEEAERLNTAWYAARYAARDAVRDAARGAAWDAARYAARYAARDAVRDAAWDAAQGAALDAALALLVRDLIGQHGFTQKHYDTLTWPWRRAIGKIHPDDEDLQ